VVWLLRKSISWGKKLADLIKAYDLGKKKRGPGGSPAVQCGDFSFQGNKNATHSTDGGTTRCVKLNKDKGQTFTGEQDYVIVRYVRFDGIGIYKVRETTSKGRTAGSWKPRTTPWKEYL